MNTADFIFRAAHTKYLGCTDSKPSRIQVTFGNRRKTFGYDHGARDAHEAAARLFFAWAFPDATPVDVVPGAYYTFIGIFPVSA